MNCIQDFESEWGKVYKHILKVYNILDDIYLNNKIGDYLNMKEKMEAHTF